MLAAPERFRLVIGEAILSREFDMRCVGTDVQAEKRKLEKDKLAGLMKTLASDIQRRNRQIHDDTAENDK